MRLAALLALTCAACSGYDSLGNKLPEGSLAGTAAVVSIVRQNELNAMATKGGIKLNRGDRVNGLAVRQSEQSCFVYLADTPQGLAALEHELWHCKGWTHK